MGIVVETIEINFFCKNTKRRNLKNSTCDEKTLWWSEINELYMWNYNIYKK